MQTTLFEFGNYLNLQGPWSAHTRLIRKSRENTSPVQEKEKDEMIDEKEHKGQHNKYRGLPPSTCLVPRSKRMRADCSERVGFPACNLDGRHWEQLLPYPVVLLYLQEKCLWWTLLLPKYDTFTGEIKRDIRVRLNTGGMCISLMY